MKKAELSAKQRRLARKRAEPVLIGSRHAMYQSLQACRAIAAALVVLFHLGGTFAQDRYFGFKALDGPFAWGDAGVDFFFVLSGFLITIVHRQDFGYPQALGGYLLKRTLRIYPTYWLICLTTCLAALAFPSLRPALPFDAMIFLKGLALIPQDPAIVGGTGSPILFVAWSLQYEMLFYAVVAVFIVNRLAGMIVVAGLLITYLACQFGSACGFPASFLSSNLILLFGMGVASAYAVRSGFRFPKPLATAIVAALTFFAFGAFEVLNGRDALFVDRRLIYGLIGSVLIIALAQAEDAGELVLHQRWVTRLGDASYSLYLLHISIISVLCKLFVYLGVTGYVALMCLFVSIFLACIAVSLAFHLTVERPMLKMFRLGLRTPAREGWPRSTDHHGSGLHEQPSKSTPGVPSPSAPGTFPSGLNYRLASQRRGRRQRVGWQ